MKSTETDINIVAQERGKKKGERNGFRGVNFHGFARTTIFAKPGTSPETAALWRGELGLCEGLTGRATNAITEELEDDSLNST